MNRQCSYCDEECDQCFMQIISIPVYVWSKKNDVYERGHARAYKCLDCVRKLAQDLEELDQRRKNDKN